MQTTGILKSRKIKLHPNREQKRLLDKFAGASRFVYNQCVGWKKHRIAELRKTHRVVSSSFVGTVEDLDAVAAEFAALVVSNVIKASSKKKSWKQSAAFKAAKKNADVGDDATAAEFADMVIFNCVGRQRVPWAESESYEIYETQTSFETNTFDLNIKFKQLFVTVKSRTQGANPFYVDRPWLSKTPQEVRETAAFTAGAAFRSANANKVAGNITRADFRFKSKKDEDKNGYTIGVGKGVQFSDGKLTMLPSFLGDSIRFYETPPISGKSQCECEISKDALGDYWLIVPFFAKRRISRLPATVAIDPGIAEPWACYSPDGDVHGFVLGERMNQQLRRLHDATAMLDSRIEASKEKNEKRHLLMQRLRTFRRAKRVRDDWHWKIINDITMEYGTILLPRLPTRRLCGGLRAKSNRKMFGISHGMFFDRLAFKCAERSATLVDANEAYSTKTCGGCGIERVMSLSDRVFECVCGVRCHRDLHAARNIYIRWALACLALASPGS